MSASMSPAETADSVRQAPTPPVTPSPVTMAAALHFDISIPNFGIQEYMRHTKETDDVFPHEYYFEKGYLHPGDKPGLGVDYDEKLAKKFGGRWTARGAASPLQRLVHQPRQRLRLAREARADP